MCLDIRNAYRKPNKGRFEHLHKFRFGSNADALLSIFAQRKARQTLHADKLSACFTYLSSFCKPKVL